MLSVEYEIEDDNMIRYDAIVRHRTLEDAIKERDEDNEHEDVNNELVEHIEQVSQQVTQQVEHEDNQPTEQLINKSLSERFNDWATYNPTMLWLDSEVIFPLKIKMKRVKRDVINCYREHVGHCSNRSYCYTIFVIYFIFCIFMYMIFGN